MAFGIEEHKQRLLQSADAAGAQMYKELRRTRREWDHKLRQPMIDVQERDMINATDLDAIAAETRPFILNIKDIIRNAKGKDDMFAGFARVVQHSLRNCTFGNASPSVHAHLARYIDELASQYETRHAAEASENGTSEDIAAKLHKLARYARIGMNANAYSGYFVHHLNPLKIEDEDHRPYSLPSLAIASYLMEKNVPLDKHDGYEFDQEAADAVNASVIPSFVALITPYLPNTGAQRRIGPEFLHLMGVAQDAVFLRQYQDAESQRPIGELLKDEELVEQARQLLLPIFAKYPNMADNFEQFLDACDTLDRMIKMGKGGHGQAVIEGRDENVVRVAFGGR